MTFTQRIAIVLMTGSRALATDLPTDPLALMRQVVFNTNVAADARRHYIYQQRIAATMSRSNGQLLRREKYEYQAVPQQSSTEKTLGSFSGEYRAGSKMMPYSLPGVKDKGDQRDREAIQELVEELVSAKDTRDGIPRTLFPLREADLPFYTFGLRGEEELRGRRTFHVSFQPIASGGVCIAVGGDKDNLCHQWQGEIWVDAEDLQPVRITTEMAKVVPWGIRVLMGINVRQYGFSINYQRVEPGVYFPVTYGTEFGLTLFWGYKRTMAISLDNNDFRKTDSSTTIHFELPQP